MSVLAVDEYGQPGFYSNAPGCGWQRQDLWFSTHHTGKQVHRYSRTVRGQCNGRGMSPPNKSFSHWVDFSASDMSSATYKYYKELVLKAGRLMHLSAPADALQPHCQTGEWKQQFLAPALEITTKFRAYRWMQGWRWGWWHHAWKQW